MIRMRPWKTLTRRENGGRSSVWAALLLLAGGTLAAETPKSVSILTYNVLADESQADARAPALFSIIRDRDPDIIALQEAAPWFLHRLGKAGLLGRYTHITREGKPLAVRGLFLMAKGKLGSVDAGLLSSRQGRAYLIADIALPGHDEPVTVATCHLDSLLEYRQERATQLKFYFTKLAAKKHVVFLGDFNFGDGEEPESSAAPKTYTDVFRCLNPNDKGFTWDTKGNPLARANSFPNEPSRRLDRILLRSSALVPSKVAIIGNAPVRDTPRLFPSDHYGLFAVLTWSAKQPGRSVAESAHDVAPRRDDDDL